MAAGSAAASPASATATATSSTTKPIATSIPPPRDVARPVSNLGNTCYMNAVLQALAHAPELCLAMDCNPHHVSCPIALENRRRRIAASGGSPSSSPEDGTAEAINYAGGDNEFRRKPARKLRRSSRKSPTIGVSANNYDGLTAPSNENNANANGADANDHYPKYCALCEMEWHLQEVHSLKDKDKAVAPTFFVHGFIDHVAPWFKLGLQEDSHEFLRLLIDAMQRSCKNARPKTDDKENSNEEDGNTKDDPSAIDSAKTAIPSAADSINDTEYPFQLFRGTVESCVTCDSCKASSSTLDPIEDVGLEVTPSVSSNNVSMSTRGASSGPPSNETLGDVSSAFQRFARVENLDAGYKCEKCGKGGRATKQSRLASIPPILTLHLKRFRYGGDSRGPAQSSVSANRRTKSGSAKIEGHIKFELVFDLRPYLTDELQAKVKAMFCRLFAVVVHAGKNSHSGHYIAYCRNISKNEWWKMDDARVTLVGEDEVMQAEAYMLFYRVVEHPFALHLKDHAKKLRQEREAVVARLAAEAALAEAAELEKAAAAMETDKENIPAPTVENKAAEPAPAAVPAPAPKVSPTATSATNKSKEQSAKQPAAAPDNANTSTSPTAAAGGNSSNSKKRGLPEFVDGKSWAKAKTRLKPSQFSSLRSAEEYINENVQFKQEFFKRLNEEGTKSSARMDQCPIKQVTGDDVAAADRFRLGLKKTIHRLAVRFEEENNESFFVGSASTSNNPAKSNLLDKFVAVGSSTVDDDLL